MSEPRLKNVQCMFAGRPAPHGLQGVGRPAQSASAGLRAWRDARRRTISTRWRAACATDYRVVCPDVVGRGRSDRLRDPAHYHVPQYVADMVTLLARVTATRRRNRALVRHLDGRPDRHGAGVAGRTTRSASWC